MMRNNRETSAQFFTHQATNANQSGILGFDEIDIKQLNVVCSCSTSLVDNTPALNTVQYSVYISFFTILLFAFQFSYIDILGNASWLVFSLGPLDNRDIHRQLREKRPD